MSKPTADPLIILASESPRRKYLLEQAGLQFTVVPSRFDEASVPPTTHSPARFPYWIPAIHVTAGTPSTAARMTAR